MTATSNAPPRAWQRMLSGRRLDLLAPRPEDIEIEDIAHGLARVARWNGQTVGEHAFSVAQHSLLVTDILAIIEPGFGKKEQCAALLHDAPEYVVGDLISPFKAAIGFDYKSFEQRLLDAIHQRFGIDKIEPTVTAAIKRADTIAAYYEATVLAGFEQAEADLYFGRPTLPKAADDDLRSIAPWPTSTAQTRFLDAFTKFVSL
ncbi:hydrolase [Hyphomicrobium methylovorum]|uniref:HD domain-containing protein n=1 Tax=Hyphomicrobium methylovorum TaxID=84 RepID=UPI0015E6CB7E|nr:HD family hydrolase [Hyphomicrobium methylovorum]MBA2127279.1 hydrolase [Hyphomicrobium methylovorum]